MTDHTKTVHLYPSICFLVPHLQSTQDAELLEWSNTHIAYSQDINDVTCQQCLYFNAHPEAQILEAESRRRQAALN